MFLPMTLATRFGAIELDPDKVIRFERGLLGFPSLRDFVVIEHQPGSPFSWLQSVDEPSLAFLVVDPWAYTPDYLPDIQDHHMQELKFDQDAPVLVLATASIPKGKPEALTLNLYAPLVINLRDRLGKQVTLDESAYTIRHRVFPKATTGGGRPATQAA